MHKLKNERNVVRHLQYLHKSEVFTAIETDLNQVTKDFIDSQLRNTNKPPSAHRWTVDDKIFALSIFKRSPKLYKHLSSLFILPSVRLLKSVLSKIPFEPGINEAIKLYIKDTIATNCLEKLIVEVISELQICGFNVVGIVCDQGPTNRAAVMQLCT